MSAVLTGGPMLNPRPVAPVYEKVKPSTLEAMERWVRWRHGVGYAGGTSGRPTGAGNLLARLVDGKRQKICTNCKGQKRVPIPGTVMTRGCPSCYGLGTVPEDLEAIGYQRTVPCDACVDKRLQPPRPTGEINGVTCLRCRGSGERIEAERYVHPATISGTHIFGRQDGDPVASMINYTVWKWAEADATFWWHHVVLAEYNEDQPGKRECAAGRTREQKAVAMGISPSFFSRCLKQALLAVQGKLEQAS